MLDFFSKKGNEDSEEIVLIEDKMPKHIAIIMDGNGRWAKKRVFLINEKIQSFLYLFSVVMR